MEEGFIYVLVSAAHPDFLKIGMTTRTPKERAAEISASTGVPYPFVVIHSEPVSDCVICEKKIHERLKPYRVNNGREFFEVSAAIAIDLVREVGEEDRTNALHHHGTEIGPIGNGFIERERAREEKERERIQTEQKREQAKREIELQRKQEREQRKLEKRAEQEKLRAKFQNSDLEPSNIARQIREAKRRSL